MSARTARLPRTARRTRLFASSAVALVAALSLTACNNGEGTKDAGAAGTSAPSDAAPAAPATEGKPTGTSESGQTGGAQQTSAGTGGKSSGGNGSNGSSGTSHGTSGTSNGKDSGKGSGQSTGKSGGSNAGSGSGTEDPYDPKNRAHCDASNLKVSARVVSRPLNTMILTATNKGSKLCDLFLAPNVRFEGAQSVPPTMESTKPQAVVSLNPGESGYAAVKLSSPTGTPDPGYTAKSLAVGFQNAGDAYAKVSLPAKGVYIDSSIKVSYWQSDLDLVSSL